MNQYVGIILPKPHIEGGDAHGIVGKREGPNLLTVRGIYSTPRSIDVGADDRHFPDTTTHP